MTKSKGTSLALACLTMACLACMAGLAVAQTSTPPVLQAAPATPTTSPASELAALPKVASIRLTGEVLEAPAGFSLFSDTSKSKTLREWLRRLAEARQDDRLAAVALELDDVEVSWSQAQELADSIRRLKEIKPVYAYLNSGRASQYLVAAAASELSMEPGGQLDITGLAAEMAFFRGTLDWVGLQPQMIQIGKYKGASEPFMNKEPSPELAGEYNKLLDDLYSQLLAQIAESRKLKVDEVAAAIDQGPFDGQAALKLKLVDRLVERSQWEDHIGRGIAGKTKKYLWQNNYGQPAKKEIDLSNPFALLAALNKKPEAQELTSPTIAIVHASGMIISGSSGSGLMGQRFIGQRTLVRTLNTVAANDKIKAVVLRIDSPGGSALASEMIYQAIRDCAKKKPVIASISGMGASGGYYIALGAPTIYADSTALVGSIGVISGKVAYTGLMDKLHISTWSVTRGKNAGLELSRPWTPQEIALMQAMAQKTYEQFTGRVTESRGKKIQNVADVAQGRIFTARLAQQNGLIDKIGGMRQAVDAARAAAGITGGKIISLPKTKTLMDLLSESDDEDSTMMDFSDQTLLLRLIDQSPGAAYLVNLCRLMGHERILLAMPYYVELKR